MNEPIRLMSGLLEAEAGPLYYEVAGEGHSLVLIHAGVADRTMWDDQVEVFARRYRVIRYDVRGYGKSPVGDRDYSNSQDLYELLRHLGVDRAYVVGLSRGGQIATDFALEHPEMMGALILVAAGLGGFEYQPNEAEIKVFGEMETAWEKGDFERVADLAVEIWVDGFGQPTGRAPAHVQDKVKQMCLSNYSQPQGKGKPVVLDPPAAGRLNDIQVPTLVIVGDLDVPGVQMACEQLAQGIADARKVVIQGVAHMVNMEKPDEFNHLVLDFLEGLE